MKKITFVFTIACALLFLVPGQVQAEDKERHDSEVTLATEENQEAQAEALILRLNEIYKMDRSDMDGPMKQELKKEVLSIKDKLQELNGGIYISGGALLVIILLIILL